MVTYWSSWSWTPWSEEVDEDEGVEEGEEVEEVEEDDGEVWLDLESCSFNAAFSDSNSLIFALSEHEANKKQKHNSNATKAIDTFLYHRNSEF